MTPFKAYKLNARALLSGLVFLITAIWMALLLAGLGFFSIWAVFASGMLSSSLVWRLLHGSLASPLHKADWGALLLGASTLFLTLPASELILGGWDPGVYLQTGMQIANHGSLQFDHPDLTLIPTEDRHLLARNVHAVVEPFSGIRLMSNDRLTPQFYHAYPSLLAIFMALFGLHGGLVVNPLLNVFCIFVFYTLVASFTKNRWWGLCAAMILAMNPAQIWMAKFSTAEILTQLLLLSGFTLLHRWHERPEGRDLEALIGGAALGLAQLSRYDTLIVLAAALPVFMLSSSTKRHRRGLMLTLGMLGMAIFHAWAHQKWIAPYYRPLGPMVIKGLALCTMMTAALLLVQRIRLVREAGARLYPAVSLVTLIIWTGWMSFNWLIRPTLHARTNAMDFLHRQLEELHLEALMPTLAGPPSRTMLYLESIFFPAGLALTLTGTVLTLWFARREKSMQPWIWGGMAVTLLLTWHPFNDLFMMWVSRRYVPLVIPWLIAGAVYGIFRLTGCLTRKRPAASVWSAFILALAFVLPVLPASWFLAQNRDWPGLITWYDHLDRLLPADAKVYTDQPGFGAPMRFMWGHNAYELHKPTSKRRAEFAALLDRQATENGSVYLLTTRPPGASRIPNSTLELVADIPLETHMIRHEKTSLPRALSSRGGAFGLYKLTTKADQ